MGVFFLCVCGTNVSFDLNEFSGKTEKGRVSILEVVDVIREQTYRGRTFPTDSSVDVVLDSCRSRGRVRGCARAKQVRVPFWLVRACRIGDGAVQPINDKKIIMIKKEHRNE